MNPAELPTVAGSEPSTLTVNGPATAAAAGPATVTGFRTDRGFLITRVMPAVCLLVILLTLVLAPASERSTIVFGTLVAMAAGLASTAIGVYGGVLVPGLLLMGVDPRFAAAASLFLQLLVIPIGAGAHYRLGNVTRSIALPLILGGVVGAFAGPFFASMLPKDVIARLVSLLIVGVGLVVLATLRWGGLGTVRPPGDVPTARVGGIGLVAGFSSGLSGAGWGPIGVKLLILSRLEPRMAIGSSLFGRVFMAAAAVLGYLLSATAFAGIRPDYWLLIPLLAGSVAAMMPGAAVLSRLGRERATVVITLLSISLALPTLIWG